MKVVWLQILNTTDETIAMSLRRFQPHDAVSVMRIVVGQTKLRTDYVNLAQVPNHADLSRLLQGFSEVTHRKLRRTKRTSGAPNAAIQVRDGESGAERPVSETKQQTLPVLVSLTNTVENRTLSGNDTPHALNSSYAAEPYRAKSLTLGAGNIEKLFGNGKRQKPTKETGRLGSKQTLPFKPEDLDGYDTSMIQKYYIAAELTREELDESRIFVLGDGTLYGRFALLCCENAFLVILSDLRRLLNCFRLFKFVWVKDNAQVRNLSSLNFQVWEGRKFKFWGCRCNSPILEESTEVKTDKTSHNV